MMNNDPSGVPQDGASPADHPRMIVARPRRRIVPARKAAAPSPTNATAASRGDYEVGYKKPPKRTQFKKGQSGNPKGRPKGAKSLQTIARRLLTEKISVRTARGENRVTRIEAMMMKLIESASKGDFRALQAMFTLYQQIMPHEPIDVATADAPLSAADAATLALFAAEIREDEGTEQ
nr:DUF5681 domain-containing protein [Sphingomonas sp. CDS-1]